MQIGFGGMFPGFGFSPLGMGSGMGMQMLFGNPMGMGNMGGFGMPGGDMYSMFQMMNQFMQQPPQYPQYSGQAPQYYGGQAQQANSGRPQFQPDTRQTPHQQMESLQGFARQNGSTDGTPIANWTSMGEDQSAAGHVEKLTNQQGDIVRYEISQSPQSEQDLLAAESDKFMKYEQEMQKAGTPLTPQQAVRMRSERIDQLFRDGQVNERLGKSNQQYLEMMDYSEQTNTNLFMKYNVPLPQGTNPKTVERSPFNPKNQAQAPAAQAKPQTVAA